MHCEFFFHLFGLLQLVTSTGDQKQNYLISCGVTWNKVYVCVPAMKEDSAGLWEWCSHNRYTYSRSWAQIILQLPVVYFANEARISGGSRGVLKMEAREKLKTTPTFAFKLRLFCLDEHLKRVVAWTRH